MKRYLTTVFFKGLRDSYPEITDGEIADEDYLKQRSIELLLQQKR
jgi:hypothetical protein